MITGWLVKIAIAFALAGVAIVETASPLVTRAQIDDVAHEAADNAMLNLLETKDVERACQVAHEIADRNDVLIGAGECRIDQNGVTVTVHKDAWSLFLKRWSKTETWYEVQVTANARAKTT